MLNRFFTTSYELAANCERALLLLFVVFAMGCGIQKSNGEVISGSVTVEKRPLTEGLIAFVPLAGTNGSKVTAMILDGKYDIHSTDHLGVGKFRVEILGLPPGIKAMAEGKHIANSESLDKKLQRDVYREIAPEFNEQSKLECTIVSSVSNTADFEVRYATPVSQ